MAMTALATLNLLVTGGLDEVLPAGGGRGLCMPAPANWPVDSWLGTSINLAVTFGVMVMMIVVNRTYNVLRAMTWLPAGLFAVMAAAVPSVVLSLNSGPMLALAVICCVYLLFSCYGDPGRTRRVFLAFLILSAGSATQYCFVVFIPVFWVICAQMRILNTRTLLASIFGLLTPWILMFGSGLRSLTDLHLPSIESVFAIYSTPEIVYLLIVSGLTAAIAISSTALNVWKTIAYNARARGYNGALTLIVVITIVAMAIDCRNLTAYVTLLDMCAAYQLTHYFVNHRFERQYAAILAVCGLYVLLYLWRITI